MTRDSCSRKLFSFFIGALGLFAMVAQALLFRDFLTVFEGNELGVGAFFGAWLIWIALGALAGRFAARFTPALGLLAIAYALAFVVQQVLIAHARELAGVKAFELFPFARMYAAAFAVNAPFSFLTGVLFTVAAQSVARECALPAARVYVVETFGGCVGGVFATVALSAGLPGETTILCAAVPLLGMAAWTLRGKRRFAVGLLALVVATVAFQGTVPLRWAAWNARSEWGRLLPQEAYRGTFTTGQGRYLYGQRGGQFVVLHNGATCDSWPPDDHAAEVAAIHLAEKPNLHSVLIVGPNALGICERLRAVSSVECVTWLHPDLAYARALRPVLRANGLENILPKDAPCVDLRAYASLAPRRYDAVILNLPDISTLAMNRYISMESLAQVRTLLEPEGVISIRIQGGDNYLGTERIFLGASVLATLESSFKHVVMKPGEETWFFASDADVLSVFPATLRKQFEGIAGASVMYPPANIPALFPPDRIVFQQEAYERASRALGAETLRITDGRPRALLFTLLLALKQAGWTVPARVLPIMTRDAAPLLAAPLVIYLLLRVTYRRRSAGERGMGIDAYEAVFLAASTGGIGMAANVLLMFAYQTRFGTLYLHIGLIAALFMAGAFIGGRVVEWRLTRGGRWGAVLAVLFALHGAFLLALAYGTEWSRGSLAVMILMAGGMTGGYFPLAVSALRWSAVDAVSVAARVQAADNLGGALAAVVAPILLVPVLGNTDAVLFLLGLLALNLVEIGGSRLFAWLRVGKCAGRSPAPRPARFDTLVWRRSGYVLAGCAIYALFASAFVASRQIASEAMLFWDAARVLVRDGSFTREQAKCSDGSTAEYAKTATGGYVFPSVPWAADVKGYAGAVHVAICVDADGKLLDYRVIKSKETQSYLSMVEMQKERLRGKNLFDGNATEGVTVVSGATVSDLAIRRALAMAGRGFASDVLGKARATEPRRGLPVRALRDVGVMTLLFGWALLLQRVPRRWVRRVLLVVAALGCGVALNLQYSMQQVLLLLDGSVRELPLGAVLWLVVVVPIGAAVFGDVYCGYMCPAGACQDLMAQAWPRRWRGGGHARVWRWIRPLRYLLLFGFVLGYACTRDYRVVQADPLVGLFAGNWGRTFGVFVLCMVVPSLLMPRFWCRILCPTGAFLSLLHEVWLLTRPVYPTAGASCVGLPSVPTLGQRTVKVSGTRLHRSVVVRWVVDIALTCAGLLAFAFVVTQGVHALHSTRTEITAPVALGATGKPRDVDMDALRQGFDRGLLSKHPADFQHPEVTEDR